MGFFDENAPTPDEQAQMQQNIALQAQQSAASNPFSSYQQGMAAGQDMSWMTQPGGIQTEQGYGHLDPSTGQVVYGDSGPKPTGINYRNAGITGIGRGSGAAPQDVAAQFRAQLQSAYPQRSQDSNWLNQQTQYFVDKYNNGVRTSGESPGQVLNYFMDRAAGAGAGGNDVAEAGKYSLANGYQPVGGMMPNMPGAASYDAVNPGGTYGAPQFSAPSFDLSQYAPGRPTQLAPGTIQMPGGPQLSPISPNAITSPTMNAASVGSTPSMSAAYAQAAAPISAERLANPDQFKGITAQDLYNDPSYAFRLQQGQQALQNSAAARGNLLTGGTAKGLIDYGQNAASQEFQNAYNRALQTSDTNYNRNYQVGSTNAANALQAALANQQAQQQANLANAGYANAANQWNANASLQSALANAGYQQQANQFNAGNQLDVNKFNQSQDQTAQTQNNANVLSAYGINAPLAYNTQNANITNALQATNQNNAANLAYGNYGLQAGNQQFQNALAGYQANTNANLGYGNLGLGYGNLGLGYYNAGNNYNLGLGNLGIAQGRLGLDTQGQAWNQAFQNNAQNWNQNAWLANFGAQYGLG